MLVQCTKKLLDELKIDAGVPSEEDPLFSWHAHLITLNHRKTVVLVNDSNRYIIVLYGLKAKDFKKLGELIIKAIEETFKSESIKDEIIEQYINRSGEILFTRTRDRASVARMNKSCDAVYYKQDLLLEGSIIQSHFGSCASRYWVGSGGEYITPSEEMYGDLEAFSGKQVFRCRTALIRVNLNLGKHNVWRRIAVPVNITFDAFHEVLQKAFGWKNYHLHEFFIYENEASDNDYSRETHINHPAYNCEGFKPIVNLVCSDEAFEYSDDIEMKLEYGIKLSEYIPEYKRIKYIYDFGDYWRHFIEVEKLIEVYDKNYPVCLEGEGNTPPEDVGGEGGYEEFLDAIADEKHPDHKNMIIWGDGQGYSDFDIEAVNRRLANIW